MTTSRHHAGRSTRWLTALLLYLFSAILTAQEKEPVYDCPVQSVVKKDLKTEVLARLEQPTLKSRDTERLISATDVISRQATNQMVTLVDVRDTAAFAEVHIPGSYNIPLYALRTKSFLKSQHIALVGTGAAYNVLAATANRLTDAGFKSVSILDGGLNAWRKAKGAVVGDPLAQQRLLALTPEQYFTERNYDHWLIVDISNNKLRDKVDKKSSDKTNENKALFPGKVNLPYQKDEKHLLSELKKTLLSHKARSRKKSSTFLMLVDSEGDTSPHLASLINEMDSVQVFYLEGGIKAYRAFFQNQKTLMLAHARMQETGSAGPKRRCEL